MLTRKIGSELLAWKQRPNHMSLLIRGARQVGKTFSIRQFAAQNYDFLVELNFEENPAYKSIFDSSLDINTLIAQISLNVPGAQMIPGKTLIFLDEIQSCPQAYTALKFFTQDKRFDVIASGSLLGISYKEVSSFPVGYIDHMSMYSLDFEEFLWAKGVSREAMSLIYDCYQAQKPVPEASHLRLLSLFREYVAIGGMPKVVQTFIDTNSFSEALRLQRGIVLDYMNDIAKYAKDSEKAKARACFLSIPKQLSRDYKRFSYAQVEQRSGSRKYGGSLQWLYDAGIIQYCYNLEKCDFPLEGNARNNAFKVYMRDTGLLVSMLEDGSQKHIIEGDLGIYKGALYENIIADIFAKHNRPLYYYEKNSQLEVDFIINYQDKVTAVEVKSAGNKKSKSMNSMLKNHGAEFGIKLSPANVAKTENVIYLPFYMAMYI